MKFLNPTPAPIEVMKTSKINVSNDKPGDVASQQPTGNITSAAKIQIPPFVANQLAQFSKQYTKVEKQIDKMMFA